MGVDKIVRISSLISPRDENFFAEFREKAMKDPRLITDEFKDLVRSLGPSKLWNFYFDIMEIIYRSLRKSIIGVCVISPKIYRDVSPVDPHYAYDRENFVQGNEDWLQIERGPIFKAFIAYFLQNYLNWNESVVVDEIPAVKMNEISSHFLTWISAKSNKDRDVRVSGLVFISRDRYVLLVKTIYSRRYCFSFPGGALEEGEEEEDAAVREFVEETGWDLTDNKHEEFLRKLSAERRHGYNYYKYGNSSNFLVRGDKYVSEISKIKFMSNPKEVRRIYWIHYSFIPEIIRKRHIGGTKIGYKVNMILSLMNDDGAFS